MSNQSTEPLSLVWITRLYHINEALRLLHKPLNWANILWWARILRELSVTGWFISTRSVSAVHHCAARINEDGSLSHFVKVLIRELQNRLRIIG